jgi:predicted enzyme related to lactoylglutathione lyase
MPERYSARERSLGAPLPALSGEGDLFGWTVDNSVFPGYATADTGTDRGIQGGLGGGEESRWATIYAKVADVDQALSRAEKLGDPVSPIRECPR